MLTFSERHVTMYHYNDKQSRLKFGMCIFKLSKDCYKVSDRIMSNTCWLPAISVPINLLTYLPKLPVYSPSFTALDIDTVLQ